jgi:hypothetical protein
MTSKKITTFGTAPRRWQGWRTKYPQKFPLEVIITRRRPKPEPEPDEDGDSTDGGSASASEPEGPSQ